MASERYDGLPDMNIVSSHNTQGVSPCLGSEHLLL